MNYHKILEVNPTDSAEVIKKSYKRLVKKYHPDLNPGKGYDEKIKEINHAYSMIVDQKQPNDKPNVYPNKESYKKDTYQYGEGTFRGPKNKDVNLEVKITLDELLTGNTRRRINYNVEGGRNQQLDIEIPKSINFGDTMIYRRKGFFENFCQPAGDVYVKILEDVSVKSKFKTSKTKKLDAETTIQITYIDILLGVVESIKCVDGSSVNVKIPENFNFDTKIRLDGKGIRDEVKGEVGDLLITFELVTPELTKEQIQCLKLVRSSIDINQ